MTVEDSPTLDRQKQPDRNHAKQSSWLGLLRSNLKVWWPIPLLGVLFWIGGRLVIVHILNRSYDTTLTLMANTQIAVQPPEKILAITIAIEQGRSQVVVDLANSTLKQLVLEFPLTDLDQVKAAISQELGLTLVEVETLVHNQVSTPISYVDRPID